LPYRKGAVIPHLRKSNKIISRVELAFAVATIGLLAVISARLQLFDFLHDYAHRHEGWQLDDLVMSLLSGSFISVILLLRRAGDLRREIGRRERSEERATKLARHDPLTGLPNRRVLNEDLELLLASVKATATECAVFLIDLDLFKPVNDIHGHLVGDAVLIEAAQRLTEIVAPHGTVARMGGDEFACIVASKSGSDLPARLAARIVRSLAEPTLVSGVQVQIGSTVGIARAPQDGTSASLLLRGADLAMYDGKRDGGGCYRFFHAEMDVQLRERVAIEAELRAAVAEGGIIPYFQPIIDLSRDAIIGFEALARWPHPTKGLIPPDAFIPVAEDIGVIDDLTYSMLRTACAAARDWPPAIFLSVNISPLQLKNPWLATKMLGILTETGFAPSRLIIEVTENAVIDDMVKAHDIFISLQNAGVRLALDDFGKGHSSLYHLRKLHFDHLKIDQSFVHSMDTVESVKIVSAVAGLGKALGMPVTAEGVETAAEADALRAMGCEHAQGFLFGRPADAAGTLALLNRPARNVTSLPLSA
jgi:diguanylate cyclase (GGDEF)-like protein